MKNLLIVATFLASSVLSLPGLASADPVIASADISRAATLPSIADQARQTDRRAVVLARRIRNHLHIARLGGMQNQARQLNDILTQAHYALRHLNQQLAWLVDDATSVDPQRRRRAETTLRLSRERLDDLERQAERSLGHPMDIDIIGGR